MWLVIRCAKKIRVMLASDTIEASETNEAGFSVAVRDERTRMRVVAMAVNTGQSVWYQ